MLLQELLCSWRVPFRHVRMRRVLLIFLTRRGRRLLTLILLFFVFIFLRLLNKILFNIHVDVFNVPHTPDKFFVHFLFMTQKLKIFIPFIPLTTFVIMLKLGMNNMLAWLVNHFALVVKLFWLFNFFIKILMNNVLHWNRIIVKNLLL